MAKLRKKVNENQAASTPVRKTQLAYVDTAVKPPRGVAKKQVYWLNKYYFDTLYIDCTIFYLLSMHIL